MQTKHIFAASPGSRRTTGFPFHPRHHWAAALATVAASMVVAWSLQARETPWIEARFSVTATNFSPAGAEREFSWSGRCVTGPGSWLMEIKVANTDMTCFFGGRNILEVSKIIAKPELPEQLKALLSPGLVKDMERAPKPGDWLFLTISPGDVPLDGIHVELPWLAFCSGGYLHQRGRVLPLPGELARFSPDAFGYEDQTEVFRDKLGLPRSIDFRTSAAVLNRAMESPVLVRGPSVVAGAGPVRVQPGIRDGLVGASSSLPDGFVGARYRVLAQTNIGGLNVPISFVYERFGRDGMQMISRRLVARGVVESVRVGAEPHFTLSPTERYSVADYRFRSSTRVVDQIRYAITNGVIPPTWDLRLQSLFHRQMAAAPLDAAAPAQRAISAVLALCLGAFVVVAALVWLQRKCMGRTG
jgi:hypothetical protein